jgi:hypothetical protein
MKTDREPVNEAWERLGDTPVNDDGELDADYSLNGLTFEVGTDREDVWRYFEEEYGVSVHALMFGEEEDEEDNYREALELIRQLQQDLATARGYRLTTHHGDDPCLATLEAGMARAEEFLNRVLTI